MDKERQAGVGGGVEAEISALTEEREKKPIWLNPQVKHITEALSRIERGGEFTRPELSACVLEDLNLVATFEDLQRPDYYRTSAVAGLFAEAGASLDWVISKGPLEVAEDIEKKKKGLRALREEKVRHDLIYSRIRNTRGGLADEEIQDAIGHRVASDELRLAIGEEEGRLSNIEQRLALIAEDETSLRPNQNQVGQGEGETLARLERKRKQAEQFRRAAVFSRVFGEHFYNFTMATSSIDELGKLAIVPGYGRLSATKAEALVGLPGFALALNESFCALLQWDVGQTATVNGKKVVIEEQDCQNRNLCALPDGILSGDRDKYRRSLGKVVSNYLKDQGVKEHTFLADRAVEVAFALHDVLFLSLVFDKARDKDTFEAIDKTENGGTGSMTGLLPVDTEKITDPGRKARSEAMAGYPSPISLAIRDIARTFIVNLLHGTTVPVVTNGVERNVRAFGLLLDRKIKLSEFFGLVHEDFHAIFLLGPFHATKAWELLNEIPLEKIEFLPGKIDMAEKAVRAFGQWLPGIYKRLDKCLARVFYNEDKEQAEKRARAESTRMIINLVGAFWRKAVSVDVFTGGDMTNKELDMVGEAKGKVKAYLYEQLVDAKAVLTLRQFRLLETLFGREDLAQTISIEALAKEPWLLEILSERPADVEPKEFARGKILARPKYDPQNWRKIKKRLKIN